MINNILQYLEKISEKYPNKVGYIDENESITFLKLKEEAKKVATEILKKNINKKPCIVFLPKSVCCIKVFLGIAYSGNFYTPIDITMPQNRIEKIIEILQPEVYITNEENYENVKFFSKDKHVIVLEKIRDVSIDDERIKKSIENILDIDPLYVLFTSGSTGVPKGVTISHRSVIDYIEWVTETFDVTEKERIGNQAPFYFDNSILDIYVTLKNGATMFVVPEQLFSYPIRLLEYIQVNKINFLFWVPSALSVVANLRALGKRDISCVKKILFCGEVMHVKQLNLWRKELPNAIFANLYGPTEITDACTFYIIQHDFKDNETIPIGKPCRNTEVLVMDEKNNIVKNDESGELCVKGTCLALGYYNNPDKTKEAFVQNPLNPYYEEKIYKTGDIVKYNETGELVFLGRKDFQIKHMGYRIELGEIETLIGSVKGIESVCCIYDEKKKVIIAVYEGSIKEELLRLELKDKLSEYMIPGKVIRCNKLPLNRNGKIDRIKLKKEIIQNE